MIGLPEQARGTVQTSGLAPSRVCSLLPHLMRAGMRREELGVIGLIGLLTLIGVTLILIQNHGVFAYTLDAPYDHLALADQIRHGNYGINAGEAVAPSSTILYPFLLSALMMLGLGMYGPFVLCVLATFAIGLLFCALADEAEIPFRHLGLAPFLCLAGAVILALNLIGLEFTGLEHSLHTALALASLLGLARLLRRGTADWWWIACIVLQPLVRFEALAFLGIEILVLLAFRKYRFAAVTVLASAILIGSYALYLHSLGLQPMPNSVILRSRVVADGLNQASGPGNPILALLGNFKDNLFSYGGAQIAVMMAGLLAWFAGPRRLRLGLPADRAKALIAVFVALASLAQLMGGSLGSYSRYEIYVLALDMAALGLVYRVPLAEWCRKADLPRAALVAALLIAVFAGYARRTVITPEAANNVYEQQFQLHRFAVDYYKGPIATDHIGWVSYQNPNYVLDLFGVGSEAARTARQHEAGVAWMDRLARQHAIGLAMIYPNLDPIVPPDWQPVGVMTLDGQAHTVAGKAVVFFATTPAAHDRIVTELQRFSPTLPEGVRLTITPAEPRAR